jgi:hypothetical protein
MDFILVNFTCAAFQTRGINIADAVQGLRHMMNDDSLMKTKIQLLLLFLCSLVVVAFLGIWLSPSSTTHVNAAEPELDASTHTDNSDVTTEGPTVSNAVVSSEHNNYGWMADSENLLQSGSATRTIELLSSENQGPLLIWSEEANAPASINPRPDLSDSTIQFEHSPFERN